MTDLEFVRRLRTLSRLSFEEMQRASRHPHFSIAYAAIDPDDVRAKEAPRTQRAIADALRAAHAAALAN